MDARHHIARASATYLHEAVPTTLWMVIILLFVSWPMLLFGWVVGGEFAAYTLFAYIGLCVYLTQLELEDELTSADGLTDSTVVKWILAGSMFLYYNLVLFIAILLAGAMASNGYTEIALGIAAIYPIYDAEMAKLPLSLTVSGVEIQIPLSVAGLVVTSTALVALLIQAIERVFNVDYFQGSIATIRRLRSSTSVLHEFSVDRYKRFRQGGISP